MIRPWAGISLRARLTLLWTLMVVVAVAGLELLTVAVLSAQLYGAIDRDLSLHARRFQQAASRSSQPSEGARDFLAADATSGSGAAPVYHVRLADGTVLTNTSDPVLVDLLARTPLAPGRSAAVHDPRAGTHRVLALPMRDDRGAVLGEVRIGLPEAPASATLRSVVPVTMLASVLLVAAGAVAAWLLVGRALGSIRRITGTAAEIGETDLGRRLEYHGPRDEVGRLAETFDGMLARLEAGFQQRQTFYSLASHELRTPLTIARGHLEVLRRSPGASPREVVEAVDVALEELAAISAHVDDMLLLGRLIQGQPLRPRRVDLGDLAQAAQRRAVGLADRRWRVERNGPAVVRGDPDQLSRALLNLVLNAIRHTDEKEQILLTAGRDGQYGLLAVADSGSGIAEQDLERIFEPWYRGARASGTGGLGLAIVRHVALAHRGEVSVKSRPGQGSTFTIKLPLEK